MELRKLQVVSRKKVGKPKKLPSNNSNQPAIHSNW
jgi:hypothetical protein